MITLCKACGTSYQVSTTPPDACKICEDARQFVPVSGQQWIALPALAAYSNKWRQHEENLLSVQTVPSFAIGQRAFLIRTAQGNILWDCIARLDEATKTLIGSLGGLKAIAISHPHYYTTMQDWAAEFDAPVYLHASDKAWIMRDSPHITLWEGETLQLTPDICLLRLGGHFPGGCVLHWAHDEGVLLSGDILQVTPGADAVSFMWSYPNMLPLAAKTVRSIADRLENVKFARLYGAFEGREIITDAATKVRSSAQRYIACLN